jgi:hypothetical protein
MLSEVIHDEASSESDDIKEARVFLPKVHFVPSSLTTIVTPAPVSELTLLVMIGSPLML